jgi:RNA polymerase sigma factor (sigma-70 family)
MNCARDTFAENVCASRGRLIAFAYSRCRSLSHAEDLAHDVIVKALQARRQFDGRNLMAWLLRIMVNQHVSLHRRAKTRSTARALLDEATPCRGAAMCDLSTVLDRVRELPNGYREVLLSLVWNVGHNGYYDVADELGVTHATVKSRLSHARDALAAKLRNAA